MARKPKKAASPGLWGAVRSFFGVPEEAKPSPKIKAPRRPRKQKTPEERKEAIESAKQVLPQVLENTTVTNARQLTALLEGKRQPAAAPVKQQPAAQEAEPSPPPVAPSYTPRPRSDVNPVADPWGGRGTVRRPKFLPAPVKPVSYEEAGSMLPPQSGTASYDPNLQFQVELKQATEKQVEWTDKLTNAFKRLFGVANNQTAGSRRGSGSSLVGNGVQRFLAFLQRASGGASPLQYGAGTGGGPIVNAAGGAVARGGIGMLRGAAAMGGRAAMAAGITGAVVAAPIALAAAFVKLRQVATDFAEAQAESTRAFIPFNAAIANAFAKSKHEDRVRMYQQAAINEGSSERLIEAVDAMKNEAMPLKAAATELLNVTATSVVGILRSINRGIMAIPGLSDYLKKLVEQGKKKGNAHRSEMTNFLTDVGKGVFNRKP